MADQQLLLHNNMDEPPTYTDDGAASSAAAASATPVAHDKDEYPNAEGYKETSPSTHGEPQAHVVTMNMLPHVAHHHPQYQYQPPHMHVQQPPHPQQHMVAGQPTYYAPPGMHHPVQAGKVMVTVPEMPLRTAGDVVTNIVWLIFGGGLLIFFIYIMVATLICLTLFGIPLGIRLFKHSFFVLAPYGVAPYNDGNKCTASRALLTVLWVPFALLLYLAHLGMALILMLSIIFIPFGMMNIKLAAMLYWPFDNSYAANPVSFSRLFAADYYFASSPPMAVTTAQAASQSV